MTIDILDNTQRHKEPRINISELVVHFDKPCAKISSQVYPMDKK